MTNGNHVEHEAGKVSEAAAKGAPAKDVQQKKDQPNKAGHAPPKGK